jgi:hypothetical protein
MTGPAIPVSPQETGVIRVFALDLPDDQARALTLARRTEADDRRLAALLGVDDLDPVHVDVIAVDDLIDGGLPGYLTEALDAEEGPVTANAPMLAARQGWVVIVLSRAVAGRAPGLTPAPTLRLLATYRTARAAPDPVPLTATSAQGTLSGPPAPAGFALPRGLVLVLLALAAVASLAVAFSGGSR